jgi:hypothetical protein
MRNDYIHGSDERERFRLARRAQADGVTVFEVLERDARLALSTMERLFRRSSQQSE